MEFTLAHVRDGARIYLQGERDSFIQGSLEDEDDYVWDEQHWGYLDHISISMNDKGLYRVTEWTGGEGYTNECDITADEVVVLINQVCDGVSIEFIR